MQGNSCCSEGLVAGNVRVWFVGKVDNMISNIVIMMGTRGTLAVAIIIMAAMAAGTTAQETTRVAEFTRTMVIIGMVRRMRVGLEASRQSRMTQKQLSMMRFGGLRRFVHGVKMLCCLQHSGRVMHGAIIP